MAPSTLKTFHHPARVYRLEYPAHWEQLQQDEGRPSGFGPHDRNHVDVWNPLFDQVLASLRITRDEELMLRKAAIDVLERLRKRYPDQDFRFDDRVIRGKDRVVYLSNLERELRGARPERRDGIIEHFVTGLAQSAEAGLGEEVWDEICGHVVPVLKPRDYIDPESPTRHLLTSEWLVDVVICYAIKRQK